MPRIGIVCAAAGIARSRPASCALPKYRRVTVVTVLFFTISYPVDHPRSPVLGLSMSIAKEHRWLLLAVCAAQFFMPFMVAGVNAVLPPLGESLGASARELSLLGAVVVVLGAMGIALGPMLHLPHKRS